MRVSAVCRLLVLVAPLLGGCGDDASGGSVTGAGGSGGSGGSSGTGGNVFGCSSATYCGSDGFLCGVHAVSSCGEVDCGACRFRGENELGWGDITSAPDGSIHLVHFDSNTGEVVYARAGEAGLEQEPIATAESPEAAAIAVADDGSVHVAYVATQVMHAVKRASETAWQVNQIAETAEAVAIAVDAQGAPHIVTTGENPTTRARELVHVTPDGSAYASLEIPGVMPIGNASIGRGPDGTIVAAVRSDLRELAVFELVDGAFERDTNVPELDDQPAEWSAAVTSDGTIKIAALLGNYTLITGSALVMLTRSGGSWSVEPMGGAGAQVTHGIVLAGGPQDAVHLAYFARNEDGLFYTRPGSPARLNVDADCDEGEVRLAIDGDDQPHLLFHCDSGVAGRYLAPVERFSDEYVDACASAADVICDRACVCGSPDCCFGDGLDSGGCYFGPNNAGHDLCVAEITTGLCGDLTADPAEVLACPAELDATEAMCVDTSYLIPDGCWQAIQRNR